MDPPSEMTTPFVKPSGLQVDFDKNITRLYEAITASNWDEAIKAATTKPKEARTWVVRHYDEEYSEETEQEIMWRFLPIHSACARQPPANLIKALLHAYPDGAKCVDDQGMYALHYACGNQASREVIRMLLMSFPDAAKLKDPRGMLPIHYLACWGPSSISVVDMVLVANRDVANSKDEDGNTPVDLAHEGEYPEREAVVGALKRWLVNSSVATGARSKSKPSPLAANNSSDEKKEQEPRSPSKPKKNATPKNATSPQHSVGRLRQEVVTLKKSQQTLDSSWEGRLSAQDKSYKQQLKEMEQRFDDLRAESRDGHRQIAELESELQEKDTALASATETIKEKDNFMERAYDERDGLRQTLADLTESHDKFKRRSEMLGDRLGSLNASLYSMMDQQNIVLDAMSAREEQWAGLSDLRREKMRELVALEEQETSEEFELKSCLLKQTKEMEAIQAVIAAVRTQG
jgi:uncharacterized coiled-coil DUF342 family protein